MTFVATKDGLFRKMIDRFGLRVTERESVTVPSVIFPTTSVDRFLDTLEDIYQLSGIGTSRLDELTVPPGKRYHILGYTVSREHAGSLHVQLVDTAGITIYLETVSSLHLHIKYLDRPIQVDEGWVFKLDNTTGTSGNIISTILYYSEDMS